MSLPGRFNPISVKDLFTQIDPTIDWRIQDYLANGTLNVFVAAPKTGKSTWAYAAIASVVKDREFMGRKVTTCPVLILAVEEHVRDVRRRLERFGITEDDEVYVHTHHLTADQLNYEMIATFIKEKGIGLVVLDTIGHHWRVESENDNVGVLAALKPWLDLARTTGAAVLLIHHETKPQPGAAPSTTGSSIRGASAFAGVVDQILILRRSGREDANGRTLHALGRFEETPAILHLELHDNVYDVIQGPSGAKLTAKDRVLAWFRAQPNGQTGAACIDATGLGKTTVFKAINELADEQLLRSPQPGSGVWKAIPTSPTESQP